MNSYFIDTSVVIDLIRGKRQVVDLIKNLDTYLYTSYIVISELCEGIYQVDNPKELEDGIIDFMEGMFEITKLDYKISKKFGEIRAELRKRGMLIEDMDIMIAASCLSKNLILLTSNKKHFERIRGLEVMSPEDFEN